ncbi:MAG: penicillin-binding protein 2, partial [Synergistaceae bacterium]|nr:penicillin-binding protein 2 [Synergistaceae bacterium]
MEILDGRLKLTLYLILLSIMILIGGLYFCQVAQADKYIRLAHNNRLRMIRSPAPRGEIFDRNGLPLAINDTTFNIMGYPLDLNTKEKLEHLSKILKRHGIPITVEDLEKTIKQQRMAPYRVMKIVPNLTMPQMAELVADYEFPRELFPLSV